MQRLMRAQTTMKWLTTTAVLALAALLAPAVAHAQDVAQLSFAYDLDSAAYVYPKMTGANGDPFGAARQGPSNIKTVGSSTSVTEATASAAPFTNLVAGDTILVRRANGSIDKRIIVTRTDASNVVIDTAVDWSRTGGYAFTFFSSTYGTTDADGWVDLTSHFRWGGRIAIQYEQGDFATGLQWIVECQTTGLDQKPNQVYPGETSDCGKDATLVGTACQFATAPARIEILFLPEQAGMCRVGIRRNGADTSDAGAAIERISIVATGVAPR